MSVSIKLKNETLTAYIKGEIDHHNAGELRNAVDEAIIGYERSKTVVLDFSDVSFMDSSGVGLVLGRYRLASSLGKNVCVDNLSERDYKIMKMSGIEKIARINKKEDRRVNINESR